MQVFNIPVILQPDEEGYVVTCPVLSGCYSQGDTIDEAIDNIREAIELCLEDMEGRGEELPDVSRFLSSTISIIK